MRRRVAAARAVAVSRLEKMPVDAIEEMRGMGARMKAILDNSEHLCRNRREIRHQVG